VPSFAVTLLFKVASDANRVEEMLELCVQEGIGLPEEAVAAIFDDCVKRSDKDLALRVEARIRDSNGGAIPSVAIDPLLKVFIADCDP